MNKLLQRLLTLEKLLLTCETFLESMSGDFVNIFANYDDSEVRGLKTSRRGSKWMAIITTSFIQVVF